MSAAGILRALVLALSLGIGILASPHAASAGANDPLFLNATTDDSHRSTMALMFASRQQERNHPVTVFLNDKGVLLAAKARSSDSKVQQDLLAKIMANGGTVYVCPMCLKHFGVPESDLIDGAKLGNPDLLGDALFRDNTRTLTW